MHPRQLTDRPTGRTQPNLEIVFKITLPCSGKITDEVDVQVLINIMGLVPVAEERSSDNGSASGDQVGADQLDQVEQQQQQEQIASDYQLARAIQQQQNELMAANNYINNNNSGGNQSALGTDQPLMQADESKDGSVQATQMNKRQRPQMRMVSHTLAIKRKKICTMHPVPVQPVASRQPEIRPPNQAPSTQTLDSTAAVVNKLMQAEQQVSGGKFALGHWRGAQAINRAGRRVMKVNSGLRTVHLGHTQLAYLALSLSNSLQVHSKHSRLQSAQTIFGQPKSVNKCFRSLS